MNESQWFALAALGISLLTFVTTQRQIVRKAASDRVSDMEKRLVLTEKGLAECLEAKKDFEKVIENLRAENLVLMEKMLLGAKRRRPGR